MWHYDWEPYSFQTTFTISLRFIYSITQTTIVLSLGNFPWVATTELKVASITHISVVYQSSCVFQICGTKLPSSVICGSFRVFEWHLKPPCAITQQQQFLLEMFGWPFQCNWCSLLQTYSCFESQWRNWPNWKPISLHRVCVSPSKLGVISWFSVCLAFRRAVATNLYSLFYLFF